ncbi:GNAT family N-acetyltransferase [Tropicimonas sp. TH_r6]|uniref:GNAT family N-acetyltransferase n=1 Tax=Tropicimonas sp. TH_r6 TaxID=3082085 RepID=UPI0029534FE0|nr:GNAT family N-acetyltransferase [Tropicimonas sp. TH_r6]MDV7144891.1 GNAT family N-acetyltransferase [Tropicimonas sp. TH_r6]
MTIRSATATDAEAITGMLRRLAEETGDGARFASTPEAIRTHGFADAPLFETLLAERQGTAAGMALFFPHFSTTLGAPGVYVQDLWVAPEARGIGIGAALLAAVARRATIEWGAAYLALSRHVHNDGAAAFYARLGFATQNDLMHMYLAGDGFSQLATPPTAEAAP